MNQAAQTEMPNAVELREYIERILEEREKTLVLTAQTLNARLEHLNALRDDVLRDRSLFVTSELWNETKTSVNQRLNKLEMWQSRVLGFGSALILLAGLIGALVTQLFK